MRVLGVIGITIAASCIRDALGIKGIEGWVFLICCVMAYGAMWEHIQDLKERR